MLTNILYFGTTLPWINTRKRYQTNNRLADDLRRYDVHVKSPQIAKFMGPTWGPPGSCRPQMGPMFAPWTLLSETAMTSCKGEIHPNNHAGTTTLGPYHSIYFRKYSELHYINKMFTHYIDVTWALKRLKSTATHEENTRSFALLALCEGNPRGRARHINFYKEPVMWKVCLRSWRHHVHTMSFDQRLGTPHK